MAYKSQPTVTRPANATAYTAGDVVGGVIEFKGFPQGSGGVYDLILTSADLRIDVAAIPAGMTSFRAHLYDSAPVSALADNAVWTLASTDRAQYLGYIDIGSPAVQGASGGSTLYCRVDAINAQIRPGLTGIYGYLVTNGAFTPAGNSEVYTPSIQAILA